MNTDKETLQSIHVCLNAQVESLENLIKNITDLVDDAADIHRAVCATKDDVDDLLISQQKASIQVKCTRCEVWDGQLNSQTHTRYCTCDLQGTCSHSLCSHCTKVIGGIR